MSSITSPILLDSTGKETNEILQKISDSLLAANTLIDDEGVSPSRVWSSEKLVKALTVSETTSGTSQVTFEAIAATPLEILTTITNAPITVNISMGSRQWDYLVPANGTYNWATGELKLPDGTSTQLLSHSIKAPEGPTTLTATNVSSIEVTYKTIASGEAAASPSIIFGGSAKEEAN